ncbi:MAG: GntG family PLP-dependent aldolase [Saprospiraceae bacterium]
MESIRRINLISDTVTLPSKGMLESMMNAKLGDDVFQEDPTVIQLEKKLASMFTQEAGLFCPSGTMANQIAIKSHTQPLDEMICEINSHVFQYEVSGYAFHSGIAVNPIVTESGNLTPELISQAIKPSKDWLPNTSLVVLENTGNRTGGTLYSLLEMIKLSDCCKSNNLKLHLDGARIFNAIIEGGYSSEEIGPLFDSVSICLSKGLGAPVGTVLLGNQSWIQKCRKVRKVMGGGMRQSGILAAAGLYALEHNVSRLKTDHIHAKQIESCLLNLTYVTKVKPVYTNIIIFDLIPTMTPDDFINQLNQYGINASAFGKHSIRFVTHLDINESMIREVIDVLNTKIK